MASRKKRADVGGATEAAAPATTTMRVTRSASRRAGVNLVQAESIVEKAKVSKRRRKTKEEDVKKAEVEEEKEVKEEKEVEEKKEVEEEKEVEEKKEVEETEGGSESKTRTVVIEHCKQCNSFKTRANLVKDGLEKAVSDVAVVVNPEKPRRGCFEIREEGGKTFISLLDMKRPFKPMKDLDMDQVVADIIDKLK